MYALVLAAFLFFQLRVRQKVCVVKPLSSILKMWRCFYPPPAEAYKIGEARLSWEQRARWEQRIIQLEKESKKNSQYLYHLGGKLSKHDGATMPLLKESETMIIFLSSKPSYEHLLIEYREMSHEILRKAFDIDMPRSKPEGSSKQRGDSCHAGTHFSRRSLLEKG